MAYKPTRRFVTEDGIAIDYELRKIAKELTSSGSGTITGVVAGTALTGGGTSGSVTLNVANVAFAQLADAAVQTSSEPFADNDTSLMTSAAIQDKILSYNYITGVTNISGNAGTATALQTARTIGGVSFDGTANIDLAGVNTAGNQNTSGNAATATALATARAINGVDFDGTAAITVTAAAGTLTGGTLNSGVTASSLTSVGTLSSLTVSGAFTPATVTASTVTVAADDLVLITDTSDSNNVKKVTAQSIADLGGGGGTPAGSNTQVQFNNSGSFGASSNMVFDGTNLTVNAGGADGGIVLGQTFSTGYVGLRTAGMADDSSEYMIMSQGGHTLISAGSTGDIYIRGGGNDTGCQIFLDTSENVITLTGDLSSSDQITTTDVMTANEFRASDSGPASDPSFTFTSDADTGVYLKATGQLGIACGGVEHYFANNGLHLAAGDWLRTYGSAGWYNGTYGGGWYMTDTTYIRTYSNRSIKVHGNIWLNAMATFTGSGYATARRQDSSGILKEYVSSERFKADITDLPLSEAVKILDSRPILFRDIEEHKEDPNSPIYAGLSAESLQEAGYEYPLKYDIDEDGNQTNIPRGIHHEHLVAPIILILRDLQEKITYLEENKCQCQS